MQLELKPAYEEASRGGDGFMRPELGRREAANLGFLCATSGVKRRLRPSGESTSPALNSIEALKKSLEAALSIRPMASATKPSPLTSP